MRVYVARSLTWNSNTKFLLVRIEILLWERLASLPYINEFGSLVLCCNTCVSLVLYLNAIGIDSTSRPGVFIQPPGACGRTMLASGGATAEEMRSLTSLQAYLLSFGQIHEQIAQKDGQQSVHSTNTCGIGAICAILRLIKSLSSLSSTLEPLSSYGVYNIEHTQLMGVGCLLEVSIDSGDKFGFVLRARQESVPRWSLYTALLRLRILKIEDTSD